MVNEATTHSNTTDPTDPIVRSPADVLRLVVAAVALLVVVLVAWLFGDTLVEFTSELLAGFGAWPQWIVDTVVVATALLALALVVAAIVATLARRPWTPLARIAVGAGVGIGLALLIEALDLAPSAAQVVDTSVSLGPLSGEGAPSAIDIAGLAGAITAGAPWLSRRWRRLGWAAVVGLACTRFIVSPLSFQSLVAVLAGWAGGAAALVALGAPSRRPTAGSIRTGLAASGLALISLEPAAVDARGSTPYFGTTADGGRFFVKALGDDERSADLLFRIYRWFRRRDLGDERPFSSLRRAVEHEALVALAARDIGVRTPRVSAFASAAPNAFVLAYELVPGRSLDRVEPSELSDGLLAAVWEQLAILRSHRIAHRDLRLANLYLGDDGNIWLIDFGFSEMAASELLLATDIAELLASSSLAVGAERAVAASAGTVDAALRTEALGRLRPSVLSGATRTGLKANPGLLEELRTLLEATRHDAAPHRSTSKEDG